MRRLLLVLLRVRGLSPAPLTYVLRSSLALIFCFSDTLFLVVTFHLGVSSSAPVLLRGFHGGVFLRLRFLLLFFDQESLALVPMHTAAAGGNKLFCFSFVNEHVLEKKGELYTIFYALFCLPTHQQHCAAFGWSVFAFLPVRFK